MISHVLMKPRSVMLSTSLSTLLQPATFTFAWPIETFPSVSRT